MNNSIEAVRRVLYTLLSYLGIYQILYCLVPSISANEFELNLSLLAPRIFLLVNGVLMVIAAIVLVELDFKHDSYKQIKVVSREVLFRARSNLHSNPTKSTFSTDSMDAFCDPLPTNLAVLRAFQKFGAKSHSRIDHRTSSRGFRGKTAIHKAQDPADPAKSKSVLFTKPRGKENDNLVLQFRCCGLYDWKDYLSDVSMIPNSCCGQYDEGLCSSRPETAP